MLGYRMVHDAIICWTCVHTILCSCKKQKKRVSSLVTSQHKNTGIRLRKREIDMTLTEYEHTNHRIQCLRLGLQYS